MNKRTIYILGNLNLEIDSLPLKLIPKFREAFPDISFEILDPTENVPEDEHLVIIDTIINSDEVRILKDIEKIQNSPTCSLHDFDLGIQLKLIKKLGKIKDVTIIGVPPLSMISEEEAFGGIKREIDNLSSFN